MDMGGYTDVGAFISRCDTDGAACFGVGVMDIWQKIYISKQLHYLSAELPLSEAKEAV
jgi:hypothetical protein